MAKASDAVLLKRAVSRGESWYHKSVYWTVVGLLRGPFRWFSKMQVRNEDVLNIPGGLILAPTHRSHSDVVALAVSSKRRLRAVGKQSLFKTPFVSWFCGTLGAIPLSGDYKGKATMGEVEKMLYRGDPVIIFPEGTRREGSEVGKLQNGVAWIAREHQVPVIPVALAGTEAMLTSESLRVRRHPVGVVFGEPIAFEGSSRSRAELVSFTEQLRASLEELMSQAVSLTNCVS